MQLGASQSPPPATQKTLASLGAARCGHHFENISQLPGTYLATGLTRKLKCKEGQS